MSGHDPLCLTNGPGPRDLCDCGTIRLVRADERERGEAIAKGMVAQAVRDERERIAQAIEHFGLVWQVYLDSEPTGIERQLAWSRVDALNGAARIAREGGRDE